MASEIGMGAATILRFVSHPVQNGGRSDTSEKTNGPMKGMQGLIDICVFAGSDQITESRFL